MNPRLDAYFTSQNWRPFEFQQQAWHAYRAGRSGLIHAPTGMGKTLAAILGPASESLDAPNADTTPEPFAVLWITPMRALATDTTRAISSIAQSLELNWTVEKRTGDTSASARARQRDRLPTVLVTTPESLSVMLSYAEAPAQLRDLRCIIVDEWHELLSSKRGVQTELALARLRAWSPAVRTWGLSATLANIDQALHALVGDRARAERREERKPALIQGATPKDIVIETLLPESVERFPWAGHLGLTLLNQVLDRIDKAGSTLVFTNTRSQTELWFRAILRARPDWLESMGLHHGSIDRDARLQIEQMLREGKARCVVCTSSLDLGVDFSPVEQVIQIGSLKGVSRLLQRAGRSGHQPGAPSRVICVPTNALEIIEFAAARDAIERREIEPRDPYRRPLDVLAQHVVTAAMGGGFRDEELLAEVRDTLAYRTLTDAEWQWTLDFAIRGGATLTAYPQFARIAHDDQGVYRVASPRIARFHRMAIGTITSDTAVRVQFQRGATLGTVEESFIARLKPGDRFIFAGRVLELIRFRDMTATVRRAAGVSGAVVTWQGGRSPLSSQLAAAVRRRLGAWNTDNTEHLAPTPEMHAVDPLLALQASRSHLPGGRDLLIERTQTRDGTHLFLYPIAGRLVHEGLAALLTYRLTRARPMSVSATVNDYGIELLCSEPIAPTEPEWRALLSADALAEDLADCVNVSVLARRRFRDICRIAGLVHTGYPGSPKPSRHLQASSDLYFDVFQDFDPENLLLRQARREVLEAELEIARMNDALSALRATPITLMECEQLSPFAFPLWAESIRTQHLSSESWSERVRKMAERLEKDAASRARRSKRVATP